MYTAKFGVTQAHHRHFFDVLKLANFMGLRPLRSADQGIDLEDGQKDSENDQKDYSGHHNDK